MLASESGAPGKRTSALFALGSSRGGGSRLDRVREAIRRPGPTRSWLRTAPDRVDAARVTHPQHFSSTYRYCTNFAVTGSGLDQRTYVRGLEGLGDGTALRSA